MTTQLHRFAGKSILACLLCTGLSQPLLAQTPNFPAPFLNEQSAIATPNNLATVNTAMIECPFGGTLAAIVQSDFNGVYLHVDYGNGTTINSPILVANTQWGMADVTIGDDNSAPGDQYIIAVTYKQIVSNNPLSYQVHLARYTVDDVQGALNVTLINDLNFGPGDDPKIDVIADENTIIGNYPAMNKLMLLFTDGSNNMRILAAGTDLSGAINMFGPTGYHGTDIAAVRDITGSGQLIACISALSNNNTTLSVIERNLTLNTTNTTLLQTNLITYNPRIEALGIYNATNPFAKWAVTTSDNIRKVMLYTNLTAPYQANPQAVFNSSTHEAPALASGIGPIYGNPSYIGNQQYTYAWAAPGSQRYFSQSLDPVGNPMNPLDFNIINNSPCYMLVDPREVVAIANCANSGSGLIAAWNEGTEIRYKQMDNLFHYRPTGIEETRSLATLSVTPNPAKDKVTIRTTQDVNSLSIINSLGAVLKRQSIKTGATLVDISDLASGTYFLHINGKDGHTTRTLVVAH